MFDDSKTRARPATSYVIFPFLDPTEDLQGSCPSLSTALGQSLTDSLTFKEILAIEDETGFSTKQLQTLWSRFVNLDKTQKGHLTRDDFLFIPELAVDPLGDRVVHAFFQKAEADPTKCGNQVDFRDFVRVLSHFRPTKKDDPKKLNSKKDKVQFAFRMYDLDGDGRVNLEELVGVLTMRFEDHFNAEELKLIAEGTMLVADQDKDDRLSFEEFNQALSKMNVDLDQTMSVSFLS